MWLSAPGSSFLFLSARRGTRPSLINNHLLFLAGHVNRRLPIPTIVLTSTPNKARYLPLVRRL